MTHQARHERHPMLALTPEVEQALRHGGPVVALESTIISHGMPYPRNVEMAREVEQIVPVDLAPVDLLGLGDDDGDAAADKRVMDQARSLAAPRTVYGIDSASARPGDLRLDF